MRYNQLHVQPGALTANLAVDFHVNVVQAGLAAVGAVPDDHFVYRVRPTEIDFPPGMATGRGVRAGLGAVALGGVSVDSAAWPSGPALAALRGRLTLRHELGRTDGDRRRNSSPCLSLLS